LDYQSFLERRRQIIARVVRDAFNTLAGERKRYVPATASDLIAAGESQTTEFKASGRRSVHTSQAEPRLGQVLVKAVCGFLNAEGGNLLIGVDDDGQVLGIEEDFTTLGDKPNVDGYELFLRQLLDNSLSAPTAPTVRIRFPELVGKSICQVSIAPSARPVFARPAKGGEPSEFWVRVGNATKQLHGDDLVKYQEEHWG
jgi:predicted HTH transcriptional regulator